MRLLRKVGHLVTYLFNVYPRFSGCSPRVEMCFDMVSLLTRTVPLPSWAWMAREVNIWNNEARFSAELGHRRIARSV